MSSETDKDQLPEHASPPASTAPPPTTPSLAEPVTDAPPAAPSTAEPVPDASPAGHAGSQTAALGTSAASPAAEAPSPASQPPTKEAMAGDDAAGANDTARRSDAPPAPAPRPSRRSTGPLWALVALAVIAAAGALAYFGYIKPRQQPLAQAQPADLQAEMNDALEDLEARQVRLRQQLEGLAPRVDSIERTLASLRQAVDKLATSGPAAVDPQAVKQLGDRIALLESQAGAASGLAQHVRSLEASTAMARDTASKLATTVLAVGQLVQAVGDGGAFVRQLAAVRSLGGDDPDVAQAAAALEPYAATGIPTIANLRAQLPATIDAVVRATPVTAGDSWRDRVVDRLASLVVVRRTGPEAIAAGGVDGIAAQAETALQGGDLQAAVTALERLEGASAQAAADWLRQARARLAADRALADLQQRAIARLSTARG